MAWVLPATKQKANPLESQSSHDRVPQLAFGVLLLAIGPGPGRGADGMGGPLSKAAAMKALVLDPLLGEAHTALGLLRSHYDYDLPGAQREFLESIQLNPNYANAHLFYAGAYLTPMGRHREAIAEMKKALELDPLSLPLNNYMGNTYLYAEEYDKALQQFRRTIDLDPTFPLAHFFFANLLVDTGKYEQAIKQVQKGELLAGASPEEASAQAAEFQTVSGSMADNPKSWPAIWRRTRQTRG